MAIKVTIPDSWEEITIGQMQKFKAVEDLKSDHDAAKFIVETFTNLTDKEIGRLEANQVGHLVEEIAGILNDEIPAQLRERVKIEGVEYGFIPNLSRHTFGEEVDMTAFAGDFDQLHNLMAILYRPVVAKGVGGLYRIEEYDSDTLEERAELFRDKMPISVANGASVFFYTIAKSFMTSISTTMTEEMMNHFTQSGAGTQL